MTTVEAPTVEAPKCPRCSGEMEVGFLLDLTYGAALPTRWLTGVPEKKWFGGVKTDRQWYRVETWRCRSCGFLESYAPPKTRVNQITE